MSRHRTGRRVAGAGQAGVASMLLCNTAYYVAAFLALWLGLGTPRGLGLLPTVRRFAEVCCQCFAY